jgi:GNAT superfamily N-acetyltransferase
MHIVGREEGPVDDTTHARRATTADADVVARIIALAFVNDPVWGPALSRADGRTDHLSRYWRQFVDGALRHSWVWIAGDGAAASVWIPPGETELNPDQEARVAAIIHEDVPEREAEYTELVSRFEGSHPRSENHYYLSLLATHPDHRGRGIGMRLLAHDLALIDGEHAAAYLESTNPANDRRYRGVGFEPIGQFAYPGDRAPITMMWRATR